MKKENSHSLVMGYLMWLFGFMGAHRFYYGRPISGCIWFFTLGLLFVGWIIDLFLIPSMDRQADIKYGVKNGSINYNLCWIFLVFFGLFGIHRFYMGKIFSGLLWLLTGGFFLLGYLYDLLTLNDQILVVNKSKSLS